MKFFSLEISILYAMDSTTVYLYLSNAVFGVDSEGKFVAVMPQGAGIQDLTDKLVQSIEAGAVGKKQAKEA